MIQGLDRRLIEKTVELANKTKSFGSRQLRAALDSSPLWGASKVEDTYICWSRLKAISVIARQQEGGLAEVADEMSASILATSSLKAALDLNWDEPDERNLALGMVWDVLSRNSNSTAISSQ